MPVDLKKLFARLNALCVRLMEGGASVAVSRRHYEVMVEHLLYRLIDERDGDAALLLEAVEIDAGHLRRLLERSLEEQPAGNAGRPVFSPLLLELVQDAWLLASIELDEPQVRSGALLLALARRSHRYGSGSWLDLLKPLGRDRFVIDFGTLTSTSCENASSGAAVSAPLSGDALSRFCTDFTAKAAAGDIDPVFGRDREIAQMIDILARRRKNNPIVVGEAGVGKTAVVEGLALRIVEGDVPELLRNVRLLGLDMGLLQAGAGVKGEFENRLKNVIDEVKGSAQPVILFIDEAHTLIGAGGPQGGGDAANLLKPALARGELRTIAATTWSEYKKYFEKDAALARRFQPVKLDEPDVETAVLILRGLKDRYEEAHGVTLRDDAVVAAAELSHRYIAGRQLPDKAVDLLDTAAARVKIMLTGKPDAVEELERRIQALEREEAALVRDEVHGAAVADERLQEVGAQRRALQEELAVLAVRWAQERDLVQEVIRLRKDLGDATGDLPQEELTPQERLALLRQELELLQGRAPLVRTEVDPDVVAAVVADWTGIPVGKVMRDRAQAMLDLEISIRGRIRGQDDAVAAVAEELKSSAAGLTDQRQPKGIFLLAGPSGVGKTETALAVADLLFGGERFLTTINMSEFQEAHTVSRLIGSPPGYVGYGEGGILTEAVRQRPYSVVLVDEVEKGHPDVMNLFYQIFDKGNCADGEGRVIDFSNTVIFLTSNLGADLVTRLCGSGSEVTLGELREAMRPVLAKQLKPALLARMTVVPYRPLGPECMAEIVGLKLSAVAARIGETNRLGLTWEAAVADTIACRCTDIDSGARAVDHIVKRSLLPLLSREILLRMGEGALPEAAEVGVAAGGGFQVVWR